MIPPCSEHATPAGWRCTSCGRTLCPECVAEERVETATYLSCTHCDGRAVVLMVPGTTRPVLSIIQDIFKVPASWFTVLLAPVLVILVMRARSLEEWGAAALWLLVISPLFWGMFFLLLRASARSYDLVVGADPLDVKAHVVVPAARAVVLTAAGSAFPVAFRWYTGTADAATSNPLLWALTLLAGALLPMVAVRLGAGESLRQALDPGRMLAAVRALGADYRVVAGLSVATVSLAFFWSGSADQGVRGPWVAMMHALSVYILMVVARFTGALLAVRGPELGFELRPDQLRPALPDAQPRGERKARPPPPPPKVILPMALDVAPPSGPLEVEHGLSAALGRMAPPPGPVARALEAGNLDAALAAFEAGAGEESLSGAALVKLGQAAFARGKLALGARALDAAAAGTDDAASASRALVILARVHAERLQDPAGAARLYRQVLARFPGTPAAEFARDRLSGGITGEPAG